MMPLERGRENRLNGVFLTVPPLVAMKTKLSSANSRIGNTALMRSPSSSGNRFTIGLPRDPRLACGTWYTFNQYIFPRLEKHSIVSCVFATNRLSMKSSSFTLAADRPRPPRRCAW